MIWKFDQEIVLGIGSFWLGYYVYPSMNGLRALPIVFAFTWVHNMIIACRCSRAQVTRRWLERAGALAPPRERAMAHLQQVAVHNRLLSGLAPEDFDLL